MTKLATGAEGVGIGVIPSTVVEGTPVPLGWVGVTVNEYFVPALKPLTTAPPVFPDAIKVVAVAEVSVRVVVIVYPAASATGVHAKVAVLAVTAVGLVPLQLGPYSGTVPSAGNDHSPVRTIGVATVPTFLAARTW